MDISLYNTYSRSIEKFIPVNPQSVRIYSCGPTVYNYAHLGNMRAFVSADILQRTLRVVGGFDVQWVMNITDVDDNTIQGSAMGSDVWREEMGKQTDNPNDNLSLLTQFYEKEFLHDISVLGIDSSHLFSMPRATHYIAEMQELIANILRNGYAYISEGNVYFNLKKWMEKTKYGILFSVDREHVLEGARIDADSHEREHVSDFVLWKARKNNEPVWDFAFEGQSLPGRPGWHIECSAMGHALLGLPFDVHTGGVDLRFPHHEDEIAQSLAGYGKETAHYWVHNEFLEVEGKKMSKSLGNFFTLRDLLDRGYNPLDIRFLLTSGHSFSVLNFTFAGLEAAGKARRRIQEYIYELHESAAGKLLIPSETSVKHSVFCELALNLHTPRALEQLFSFINLFPARELTKESKEKTLADLSEINNVFAVWEIAPRPQKKVEIPEHIAAMAERRFIAKQNRDFALADQLREQLTQEGYTIRDIKNGYEIISENMH